MSSYTGERALWLSALRPSYIYTRRQLHSDESFEEIHLLVNTNKSCALTRYKADLVSSVRLHIVNQNDTGSNVVAMLQDNINAEKWSEGIL